MPSMVAQKSSPWMLALRLDHLKRGLGSNLAFSFPSFSPLCPRPDSSTKPISGGNFRNHLPLNLVALPSSMLLTYLTSLSTDFAATSRTGAEYSIRCKTTFNRSGGRITI
uniref:Uncharacterized protein n=1 Tax=Kalanchoe fedtschenkoi TaxID=63787 RepID=A0A7N1A5U3_KALFE